MALVEFPKTSCPHQKYSSDFFRKCFFDYISRDDACRDFYLTQQLRVALFHCKNAQEVFQILSSLSTALHIFQDPQVFILVDKLRKNFKKRKIPFLLQCLHDDKVVENRFAPLFQEVLHLYFQEKKEWFLTQAPSFFSEVQFIQETQKYSGKPEITKSGIHISFLGTFWFD